MQFYKRLWKSQDQVLGFDLQEIKKNLRRNRYTRKNDKKSWGARAEKIYVNFKRKEGTAKKGEPNEKEAGGK